MNSGLFLNPLKALSSVFLIARYILRLGQAAQKHQRTRCPNPKMYLEIRRADERLFNVDIIVNIPPLVSLFLSVTTLHTMQQRTIDILDAKYFFTISLSILKTELSIYCEAVFVTPFVVYVLEKPKKRPCGSPANFPSVFSAFLEVFGTKKAKKRGHSVKYFLLLANFQFAEFTGWGCEICTKL